MLSSQRCGAKTRSGKGNQNALKHGRFTKKAIEERGALRKFMREADKFLEEFET